MTYAAGRTYLAIPGPSVIPDRVLGAMHRASPDIYAGELPDLVPGLFADLRAVARTKQHVALYIANGHGAWEAANTNMFSPGDAALCLITGRFGEGWANWAAALGVDVQRIDFGRQHPVDPGEVKKALLADAGGRIKAVLMTHVDTTTSVRNDIAAVRAAIDAAGHPALLAVDGVASLACDRFEMDAWGVDVMVSASQKGLMTPPGLSFVWISDKALAACRGSRWRTPYWDWYARSQPQEFYQQFGGTAPTHHLFGLRAALDMIKEEGLEAVWDRHEALARAVWSAVEAWDAGGADIRLNIADPALRSHAVTTVRFKAPFATSIREWVQAHAGVTLGLGLGMTTPGTTGPHDFLRIAHMGHVNAHMTLGVLGTMEAAMSGLGLAHGTGALSAAAASLALPVPIKAAAE
jgi:alanine-glyoxylate transaminase/serine-glyoxylate transaminase/serine-pyruvate transaminase